jgi:hypothetical protein
MTVISGDTGIDKVQNGSIHEEDINADVARLGVGQTWQTVTGSRSASTLYTNTTGKPSMVALGQAYGTTGDTYIYIGGIDAILITEATTSTSNHVTFIVPNNVQYRLTKVGGLGTAFNLWAELR